MSKTATRRTKTKNQRIPDPKIPRIDRFVPVPLSRWETILHWSVWIVHIVAAFYTAYRVSHGYLKQWISHHLAKSRYMESSKMDNTDPEWLYYTSSIKVLVSAYLLHSIGFYLSLRLLRIDLAKYAIISVGIITQIYLASVKCVAIVWLFALLVIAVTCHCRYLAVPWVLCVGFILQATSYTPFTFEGNTFYREFNIYLYGAVKALNFCIFLCRNKDVAYKDVCIQSLLYLAYLPYSMTLIVLYEDFTEQFQRRISQPKPLVEILRSTIPFAVRLLIWYFCIELFIHLLFVNALYNSPFVIIDRLHGYELASISYVAGCFFHIKYVVIFGLPALFASFDDLRPPPGPICISRVSRYSRMWRHFDVGLHQFLKHQVYIPLMSPQLPVVFSILRGLFTLCAVFLVVLTWHGFNDRYICWVSLSALELVVEKIAGTIWGTQTFQDLRTRIGDSNIRRLVSVGMLATVIPGIFGVFFFLGTDEIGSTVFRHILTDGVLNILRLNISIANPGFVFLHLLVLGYFFNNVCLDFDINRKRKNE